MNKLVSCHCYRGLWVLTRSLPFRIFFPVCINLLGSLFICLFYFFILCLLHWHFLLFKKQKQTLVRSSGSFLQWGRCHTQSGHKNETNGRELKAQKWKHKLHNPWNAGKAVPRGKFIETQAFLKKQEKSHKQPNLPPKRIRRRTNKIQSQQKEENNKDQRGDKKSPKTIEQINETNNWFFF